MLGKINRGASLAALAVAGGVALAAAGVAMAAAAPRALVPALGGLWQVARSAGGAPEQSVCLPDPILLGQWEHRGGHCSRVILSDEGNRTLLNYSCTDGGFGRSEITVLTPRTLRIATQGIAAEGPFNYVLHARRVGHCAPR